MNGERILELGHFAAGFCGRQFVAAGCEVLRIEPPASRTPSAAPPSPPGWVSPAASDRFLHGGKRRLTTSDRKLIADLAASAQVVIAEADTADALDALGFDAWRTPVKVAITPFGRTGPKRNWQATPHTLLAMGGYTRLMGDAGRAPLSLPGHYVEFQAGQYGYIAASACRLAGESNSIDIGMLETVMSLSQFTTVLWHCRHELRARHGNDFWSLCPINLFRLRDGWAYVNVVPGFWDAFTLFLDRPELAIDERFATNDRRVANREVLNALIAAVMADLTKAEAEQRAEAVRVPVGVMKTLDEVLDDPHLRQRAFWQDVTAPDGGRVRSPALPYRIDGMPHEPLHLDEPEQIDEPIEPEHCRG
jgi:crotonobetainyl-CoA:carnitine CoA-transferase CaiB-like acyl-CoA transferase